MSSLIFVSPLAVSAMISMFLGWKMRLIMFGAWLSVCIAVALLLMKVTFGDTVFSPSGLTLLGALMMFQVAAFGSGLLIARARNARAEK